MPDINSSQICLTPFDENAKTTKEEEAAANSADPVFWPPPYMQHPGAGQQGIDMYPFSNNYREAGNEAPPPNTVEACNPQGDQCKHKKRKLSHWLFLALGVLIVGCASYQLGKRCGFWRGYRRGSDDEYYRRRERGCRDEDGYWRREASRYDNDDDRHHYHHDRYDGDLLDWALEGNDERYRFGGREGGQSCEFRRREEDRERREHMDVCTHGTDDRRMLEWDNREEDFRYLQVVQDPPRDREHERPRTLQALETMIEGTQVFMILQDEGLSEMGDFGGNFPSFANLVNTTLSMLNSVVEVDPAEVVSVNYYIEPLDETFVEEARAMLDGYYDEDCEFRGLVREMVDTHDCAHTAEFMLPYHYDSNADSTAGLDMHMYHFCMEEREPLPYKK